MFKTIKNLFELVKFVANAKLIDGTEIQIDGDLVEGSSVFVVTDGEPQPLPDGTYTLDNNISIDVLDGKIVAVTEIPEETPEEEVPVAPIEEAEGDIVPDVEPEVTDTPEADDKLMELESRIAKLEEIISTLVNTDEEMKVQNEELKSQNEELKSKVTDFETKLSKIDGDSTITKTIKKPTKVEVEMDDRVKSKIDILRRYM